MKADQHPSFSIAKTQKGIFVEIGSWEGDFSYELLNGTNCDKLYCVDPYKHFEDSVYPDGMNSLTQTEFDMKFKNIQNRFSQFGDRVQFIRTISSDAAKQFEDNSLDFVYIDGNHDYKYVLEDIISWFPKIKKGGYLCWDDVYSTNVSEHDSQGNIIRVWERDNNGEPLYWGKYGTYTALLTAKEQLHYTFKIDKTQFIIHKD